MAVVSWLRSNWLALLVGLLAGRFVLTRIM